MTSSLPTKSTGLTAEGSPPETPAQQLQLTTGNVVQSEKTGLSYTCEACICTGAFGSVWYCTENSKGIYCALKIVPAGSHRSTSPKMHKERFKADQAKEKYVPKFIESSKAVLVGRPETRLRITATEFLDGVCVRDLCAAGGMPWQVTCRILTDVLNALTVMHGHGIIHGAVRTERVVVTSPGRSYLCDFDYTSKSDPVAFLAPELHGRTPEYTTQTDMWGFGVLATKIAAGTGTCVSSREAAADADSSWLVALATKIASGAGISVSISPTERQGQGQGGPKGQPSTAPRVPEPAGFPKAFAGAVHSCLQAEPKERVTSERLLLDFSEFATLDMYRDVHDYLMYYDIVHGGA